MPNDELTSDTMNVSQARGWLEGWIGKVLVSVLTTVVSFAFLFGQTKERLETNMSRVELQNSKIQALEKMIRDVDAEGTQKGKLDRAQMSSRIEAMGSSLASLQQQIQSIQAMSTDISWIKQSLDEIKSSLKERKNGGS